MREGLKLLVLLCAPFAKRFRIFENRSRDSRQKLCWHGKDFHLRAAQGAVGIGPEGDFTFEELKAIEGTDALPAILGI